MPRDGPALLGGRGQGGGGVLGRQGGRPRGRGEGGGMGDDECVCQHVQQVFVPCNHSPILYSFCLLPCMGMRQLASEGMEQL